MGLCACEFHALRSLPRATALAARLQMEPKFLRNQARAHPRLAFSSACTLAAPRPNPIFCTQQQRYAKKHNKVAKKA